MLVRQDLKLEEFQTWSGATHTKRIIIEYNKEREFEEYIEENYPEGIDETELNDLLWFYDDQLYKILGIPNQD